RAPLAPCRDTAELYRFCALRRRGIARALDLFPLIRNPFLGLARIGERGASLLDRLQRRRGLRLLRPSGAELLLLTVAPRSCQRQRGLGLAKLSGGIAALLLGRAALTPCRRFARGCLGKRLFRGLIPR